MAQTRLLGILCNWSPFACFNAAGMAHLKMPSNAMGIPVFSSIAVMSGVKSAAL